MISAYKYPRKDKVVDFSVGCGAHYATMQILVRSTKNVIMVILPN